MTIASKLETINEALGDIKSSIVAKGVIPTGDITTYSTAIDNISGGGGMDTVEATNYTGEAITSGDKVWINQSGSSYTIEDYTVYNTNVTSVGSPTISNNVASNFSSSNYLKTVPYFNITAQDSWEICMCFDVTSATSTSYGSYASSFGRYVSGPYIAITNDGRIFGAIANGSSYIVGFYGLSYQLNQKFWIRIGYDSSTNIANGEYSTDGVTFTALTADGSTSISGFSLNTEMLLGYGSSGTYLPGHIYLDECYIKVNGVETWRGFEKTDRINAPDTALTGTAAENIAIGGTGDVEVGNVIEPTLGTKTITVNGTYNASSDNLDGFSSVTVDVPSAPTKKYNLLDRVKDDSNNEIGTVSGFFTDANNVEYAVVCLDAQYRLASGKWCSNQTTVVTDLPVYGITQWGPWEAKETATYNTQKILDFCTANGYNSEACDHCRLFSSTIDGTTYYGQLPNMIELNDIVKNHTAINTADPTASSYTSVNFAVGKNVWSSSQVTMGRGWFASVYGHMFMNDKTTYCVVAPVLEIPNT